MVHQYIEPRDTIDVFDYGGLQTGFRLRHDELGPRYRSAASTSRGSSAMQVSAWGRVLGGDGVCERSGSSALRFDRSFTPMERLAEGLEAAQYAASGVTIFRRDAASSYGWWGNIAVVLGRGPPDADHVANYRACVVELHNRYPRGVGLITVVKDTSTPSASGRAAMMKMFKDVAPILEGSLFVPDATGFRAAILRSVMSCFVLASGQRDRVRVEPSISRGMPWLAGKVLGPDEGKRRVNVLTNGVIAFCTAEAARPM